MYSPDKEVIALQVLEQRKEDKAGEGCKKNDYYYY